MSINFATLQGLTIPEGVVTQIAKDGVVLWALQNDKPIILEVEKIISDTYAGETTYTAEEFILLDIYPKTNGTVNVTYGGLTKTITDTSGAENPNAQEVFFGTFNGVSDSVATPSSGMLTIEGDYSTISIGTFTNSSKAATGNSSAKCITGIFDLGNIEIIRNSSFYDITDLIYLTIPSSVTSIGTRSLGLDFGAFENCIGLTDVIISEGVQRIEAYAFRGCTGLTNATIPSSVKIIATNALDMDNNIGYCGGVNPFTDTNTNNFITVNNRNPYFKIDGNCLIDISKNVLISGFINSVIPSYITRIGAHAFRGCTGLTNVTLPNNLTEIGFHAFYDCTGLTNVTIPSSVTSIGNDAFRGCTGLTNVTIPSSVVTMGDSVFNGCTGLTNVTIPTNMTSIPNSTFYGCTGLTNVTIPSSVTSIGSYAFFINDNDKTIRTYNLLSTTPPTVETNSFGITIYDKIIVPKGCLNAYLADENWKNSFSTQLMEAS